MKKSYNKTGKCIWCGRTAPDASFSTEPHILPHSLGGNEIGVDVCDDCNHYFGKATKGVPSINLAFKEIFNAFKTFGDNLNEHTYEKYSSMFFQYRHSQHKIIINKNFNSKAITRQFKRSLYEVFLQKYHAVTGNGNHPMFDAARKYARYGIGELHVYYAYNNIILATASNEKVELFMSDKIIEEMIEFGLYHFWLFGHMFYLEVFPVVFNVKGRSFLQKEAFKWLLPALGNEAIYEFNDVMQIDFLMDRFNPHKR